MKIKKLIKQITKTAFVFCLIAQLIAMPIIPAFSTPISPKIAEAAGESCSDGGSSPSGTNLQARVGGVALDQAATFLANMDDITGAYYDSALDRIVFVGKQNTLLPKFDKDDLAVAIKAVIFNKTIPALSIESDPADPTGPYKKVLYYGGIEDTRFGQVLFDADWALKKYVIGYDENQQPVTSSVTGYKSQLDRYLEIGPDPNQANNSGSRFWITPDLVSLKKDDNASSFVFDQVKMKVNVEFANPDNDPAFNQSMTDFVQHHTDHFDEFALETPAYTDTKQLGKIVAVIKWLNDNGIATDFNWARDYAPKFVSTPRQTVKLTTPQKILNGKWYQMSGGVEYTTKNTYNPDNGASSAIKTASEAVNAPKEEIHWTFIKDGQQYESVAVAADAFRSLGSYNTTVADMSFPTAGDLTLALNRSYSSYSGAQYGMGRGWSIIPAQLNDNAPHSPQIIATCPTTGVSHLWKLALDTPEGGHETFTFPTCAGYVADDPSYHSKITASDDNSQFIATSKNQTQYIFDQNLKLSQIKDKNSNTISYNYDGTGKLASITDSKNHQITVNYSTINGQSLISSLQDWSGRTVNYTYDDQGNLLTVTDPRGNVTTYAYDTNYKLISITDREGEKVIENTYTPEAKLATQTNASDLTTTYSHDDANRIITISDNLGRSQKAVYDEKARVLQQIDPLNKAVVYTYGTELAPLTVTDKNARTTTFTYDANGNLTTVTYPDTKKATYQYDAQNRLTKIIDERYGTPGRDTTNTYDGVGNLTQINKAGQITNFTYDPAGEALTVVDPLNHTTTWTRDNFGNKLTEVDPSSKTTAFEYDAIARLTKETDPNAKVISYTYDGNGNVLTFTNAAGTTTNAYDKENRLTKTTLPNNSVTEYSYNPADSLTSVKDAMTNITNYGYNTYQNLTSQQDALNNATINLYDQLNRQTQSTTPLGKISKWEYDANGNISKRIDANNNATSYLYDAFNRLTKITYPDAKTIAYAYDNRGNMTQMVDPVGTTTYTYDTFDRLLTAKNPYGRQITYTYDNADNLTQIKYPDSRIVTYAYDNNNRLISAKDWNNQTTTYTYTDNGLLAGKTQPNGVVSNYSYDSANRLSNLEHIKSDTTLAKFAYERDSIGNITKVTEEGSFFSSGTPTPTPTAAPTPTPTTSGQDLIITGISTSPATPSANTNFTINLTVKNQGTAPTGNQVVTFGYYYDLENLPTYSTSSRGTYGTFVNLNPGQETTISFNVPGITTSGSHAIWALADKTNVVPETDENNNTFGPYAVTVTEAPTPTPTPTSGPTSTPALTPTPGATSTPTPTPSQAGPDLIITDITTSPANPTKYQLFTVSTTVKNQGTVAVSYEFIKFGYYFDLSQPPTYTTTTNKTYSDIINLAPGESQVVNYGGAYFTTSGSHTVHALVDRDQTLPETNEINNAAGPAALNVASSGILNIFARLGLTNIVGLFNNTTAHAQEVNPQFITSFIYDPLSRLLSASYPDTLVFSYGYDSLGNRLTQNIATPSANITIPYTYNNDNQLTNIAVGTLTYDNNGNQTKKTNTQGSTNFLYNFENRLTKYTPPAGSSTTYTYDGNQNRLAKVVGSTTTRFVTDISGNLPNVLAETNSYNSITKSYIYGNGLISQGTTSTSSRNYYLEDGQGNIRFVTDYSGNKVRSTEYDPFGNWRAANGQANIQMLYQGQQQDPESNLYYLRARYYDPATGRFISRDPIKGTLANPQSQNPYQYAYNNPINLSDPSGEQVAAVPLVAACVVGAGLIATSPSIQHAIGELVSGLINGATTLFDNGNGSSSGGSSDIENRNPKQDTKLSEGEIKSLQKGGQDIEGLKRYVEGGPSKGDLYKDPKTGDIYVKPKGGAGPGEPTGLNIKDF